MSLAQELPVVEHDCPEARRLADLISLHRDLRFCCEVLKRLLDVIEGEQDAILQQALWSAALVSYARCFASGKRLGLTEDVFSDLQGDPVDLHRYLKNQRDKYVAHSVNPFEDVRVGVVLASPENGPRGVIGTMNLIGSLVSDTADSVRQFGALAAHALNFVAKQTKDAETKYKAVARSLDLDDLYSRSRPRFVAPGPDDAGRARSVVQRRAEDG